MTTAVAIPTMSKRFALATMADDRMNAVAVREFRQAVQSRWVVGVLMLFIAVNLCVFGSFLMLTPDVAQNKTVGRDVFLFLFGILAITCIWFVPVYCSVRLAFERSCDNADLLFVSALTPGAIVRGKYIVATGVTLLIFSVCLPFLTFNYLLRGIDLPTIFLVLLIGFALCEVANALGILVGAVSGGLFLRGAAWIAAIAFLLYMTGYLIDILELVRYGHVQYFAPRILVFIGVLSVAAAIIVGACYVLSVALLTPKPANRMLPPRIYITACWAMTGGASIAFFGADAINSWASICNVATLILTLAALAERDSWCLRVRKTIPRNLLLRAIAFVFYSGSAGGVIWAVSLYVGTMATAIVAHKYAIHGYGQSPPSPPIFYGYILCYCLTIAACRHNVFRNFSTKSIAILASCFGLSLWLMPYLAMILASGDGAYFSLWYLVRSSDILGTSNNVVKETTGSFVFVWFIISIVLSAPWVLRQWRRFQPFP